MRFIKRRGWYGDYPDNEAAGAIPNGARIVKVKTEEGDGHPIGTHGTVLASVSATPDLKVLYWVEWDASPRAAVAVADFKIARAST